MKSNSLEIDSPAKINLFLAVMGERGDGYHEVLSLVGKVRFGDTLWMELVEGGVDSIECEVLGVPLGEENLIMKAIGEVRKRYEFGEGVKVILDKRIPVGSGLGGGSSNGVAALKGLNRLLGGVLSDGEMRKIAVGLGSDCPIFLEEGVIVVRGRGEVIEGVEKGIEERISGQRLMIFKPKFSVNTGWAYGEMRKSTEYYISKEDAEARLEEGFVKLVNGESLGTVLYNSFEDLIIREHGECREIMKRVYEEYGVRGLMSGSGSACFLVLNPQSDPEEIKRKIEEVFGKGIFMIETIIE